MSFHTAYFYAKKGGIVMAKRGNKPLQKKEGIATPSTLHCLRCNESYDGDEFYASDSELHESIGKIPYCRKCLDEIYQSYLKKYEKLKYPNPERNAVERICMSLDIYYSDKIFDSAVKLSETKQEATILALYLKQVKLYQYRKKNYDTTIEEKFDEMKKNCNSVFMYKEEDIKQEEVIQDAVKFFGSGFSDEDYIFLNEQYADWTTRHECATKAQEEVFKRICFKQLEILKATRRGDDTKDLDATFQKLLDAAKLQPKQNSGDTTANNQTFGTLIDKWENTRPIPEIDEDLRDVDKIGRYIDIFFRGHLAKMMGLKNGLSNLYNKFIRKYTVEKPEYSDDEDSEVLFDAIFGNSSSDDD
jgi:hypothetical protein